MTSPRLRACSVLLPPLFLPFQIAFQAGRTVPKELLMEMANDRKLWVAINDADQPIGFIGCRNMDNVLYIHEISVAYEFQKQGVGRKLMLTALNDAASKGYAAVGLTTRRDAVWNMPFYKTLGFFEILDIQEYPNLWAQLQDEIKNGATASIRCAMVKKLPANEVFVRLRAINNGANND